jgi:GxxExxY protein
MNEIEFKLQQSLRNGTANVEPGAGGGLLYKELSYAITGAAIQVHKHLGPGQLESVYERALAKELGYQGIAHECQVPITATYKGDPVGEFFADIVVERRVILELKSVAKVLPVHRMQVLSYLRASGLRLGLLINFNAPVVWREIRRVVL